MSDIRKTVGDLTDRGTFDGTEQMEVFPTSLGVSRKKKVGTAAERDVTTSATDTTAGRVTKVGDGGLLGDAITDNAFDTIDKRTQFMKQGSGGDSPSAFVTGLHIRNTNVAGLQMIGNVSSSALTLRARSSNAGVWTPWRELHHSGNLPYETGTWTPELSFGGASVGITYSVQQGRYTRVGNRVFYDLAILLTNKGSSVGQAFITLPLVSAGPTSFPGSCFYSAISIASGDVLAGRSVVSSASCLFNIMKPTGSSVAFTDVNATNTSLIRLSGHYQV